MVQQAMNSVLAKDAQDKLQSLNDHQIKWLNTPVSAKLQMLEKLIECCSEVVREEEWEALGDWTAQEMMGYPAHTPEGQFYVSAEAVIPLLLVKQTLERFVEAYKMACGVNSNKKTYEEKLTPRIDGRSNQIIMDVFPLFTKDKFGAFAGVTAEWWLDPAKVTSVDNAPQPFDLDAFSDNAEDGVLVVLGAGNYGFLTLVDLLEGIFVRQRTVLVKHHPLRGSALDPFMRKLFQPLYEAGVLESVMDLETVEANSALVYHPLVKAVHMTGGKATHDAIVWGSKNEQDKRKKQMKPKLNAEMTSELGCVTPWIMVPAQYTHKQLVHHAQILMTGVYTNASCNCLSPKVVVLDDNWEQKDEFIRLFQQEWQSVVLPVAYYPGCRQRWDAYKKSYPSAVEWDSKTGQGAKERQLKPPMMNAKSGDKEATVLPLLSVFLDVDLTSKEGRQAAEAEYAFQQEPFCPVVTFATVKNTTNLEEYLATAATLCNDYIYGSLSCTVCVPDVVKNDLSVRAAIAQLKYGNIGVNLYTGFGYAFGWGGHASKERLECVESGLGRINNYLFVPHVEKTVVWAPFVWNLHQKINPDFVQAKKELDAVGAFAMKPGAITFLKLLGAVIQIPKSVTLALSASAVVAASFLVRRQLSR